MTRNTPASTYDDDFFAWTQEQAAALRHLSGDTTGIDIEHLAEEIEDLGKRDLREVGSFLTRLIEHLIKIEVRPASADIPHWRSETRHFAESAYAAYSPSMRQMLDVTRIWSRARKTTTAFLADIGIVVALPTACPFALDDLLNDDFDLDRALAILSTALDDRPDGGDGAP